MQMDGSIKYVIPFFFDNRKYVIQFFFCWCLIFLEPNICTIAG